MLADTSNVLSNWFSLMEEPQKSHDYLQMCPISLWLNLFCLPTVQMNNWCMVYETDFGKVVQIVMGFSVVFYIYVLFSMKMWR